MCQLDNFVFSKYLGKDIHQLLPDDVSRASLGALQPKHIAISFTALLIGAALHADMHKLQ